MAWLSFVPFVCFVTSLSFVSFVTSLFFVPFVCFVASLFFVPFVAQNSKLALNLKRRGSRIPVGFCQRGP